ncbi:MAG: hypothetical protein R2706_17415 [Acidimicrobiales bacterium]
MTSTPRERRSLAGWLPAGTAAVALGLAINGAATYVFLGLPARSNRLDPHDFAIFSTLWFTAYLIGPGLFIPLEQELARRVATARAKGLSPSADEKATLLIGTLATLVVGVALLAFAGPIGRQFFGGERRIVAVLAMAIASTGVAQWTKGMLAGRGLFTRYGILVGAEGLARVAILAVFVAIGPETVAPYTVAVAISPLGALFLLRRVTERGPSGEVRPILRQVATSLGVLASAQFAAQFLMNGVPLALAALGDPNDKETVGRVGAALVLARVPLFLFQAIQASLLPGLAALAELDDMAAFRHRVRSVAAAISVLGLAAIAGGAVLGPYATRTLFGPDFESSPAEFASLVASAIAVVLALVSAQALIALNRHRLAAVGWLIGAAAFVVLLGLPLSLLAKVLVAGIVGPSIALVAMVTMLSRAGGPGCTGGRGRCLRRRRCDDLGNTDAQGMKPGNLALDAAPQSNHEAKGRERCCWQIGVRQYLLDLGPV